MQNPYQSPQSAKNLLNSATVVEIGRMAYLYCVLAAIALICLLNAVLPKYTLHDIGLKYASLVAVLLLPTILRCRQFGTDIWLAWLLLVPGINLGVIIFCLTVPAGAGSGERRAGWLANAIILFLVVASVLFKALDGASRYHYRNVTPIFQGVTLE